MPATVQIIVTVAGWTGAICSVVAYGLVSGKKVAPDSLLFQLLNLVGAALLSVSATANEAWPSAVVNVVWVVIGVFALRTLSSARRKRAARLGEASFLFRWLRGHANDRNRDHLSGDSQHFAEVKLRPLHDHAGIVRF